MEHDARDDHGDGHDGEERLEVHDAMGRPTGIAKARDAIHRDGDWHLAFFCWIVREGASGPELVLQRRAATKDVWPGRYDASAAGHVRFGETTAQAAREIEEELGVHVEPRELQYLRRHRQEHVHDNGLIDRELHEVHLLRSARALDDYCPGPEVSGLVAVPIDALQELVDGRRDAVATTLVTFEDAGRARRRATLLRREHLVPYEASYLAAIAAAVAAWTAEAPGSRPGQR